MIPLFFCLEESGTLVHSKFTLINVMVDNMKPFVIIFQKHSSYFLPGTLNHGNSFVKFIQIDPYRPLIHQKGHIFDYYFDLIFVQTIYLSHEVYHVGESDKEAIRK